MTVDLCAYEPSREDLDEQIEELRGKQIHDANIRMKKHPELWPHMPSDRYGTCKKQDNANGSQTQCGPQGARSSRQSNNNPGTIIVRQSSRNVLGRNDRQPASAQPAVKLTTQRSQPQRTSLGSASVVTTRKATSSTKNNPSMPIHQKIRATNLIDREAARQAARTGPPSGKNVFITPKMSNEGRHQIGDHRCPDDSGVENDSSSSVDTSDSGPIERGGEGDPREDYKAGECSEGQDDSLKELEEARRELEELARREAEDRRKRQLIVENILSKFNSNP